MRPSFGGLARLLLLTTLLQATSTQHNASLKEAAPCRVHHCTACIDEKPWRCQKGACLEGFFRKSTVSLHIEDTVKQGFTTTCGLLPVPFVMPSAATH